MANNIPDNKADINPHKPGTVVPAPHNLAVNLIRTKLDNLYAEEPDATIEEAEVVGEVHRSKHQQFMYELMTSGKGLVQVQTEWHNYYQSLSDQEKHQVWQEFYASNKNAVPQNKPQLEPQVGHDRAGNQTAVRKKTSQAQKYAKHVQERAVSGTKRRLNSPGAIRKNVRSNAQLPPKLTWKHHLQSALFGLSMGAIVVIVLMFSFFNEVIIAPFIQPSRHDTATPIILSADTVAPSTTPEVIIPKINVEIPVDYSETSTNESVIENDLEDGVVHYPTTSLPGQNGNAAFFGHSSNNILNPGQYKFAFVLLHDLVAGDVFYLTYNDHVYAYKVFSTEIVSPSDVSVLNPVAGHQATATLITCDPPGTSINRLIVVGDQISPSPSGNIAPTIPAATTASKVTELPGNGPSLWHRFISTVWGKLITIVFVAGAIWLIWRWYAKEFRTV